jgi:hypothetical protein
LSLAINERISEGVFGGTGPKDRRRLRVQRIPLADVLDAAESRLQRERRLFAAQLDYEREHADEDDDDF